MKSILISWTNDSMPKDKIISSGEADALAAAVCGFLGQIIGRRRYYLPPKLYHGHGDRWLAIPMSPAHGAWHGLAMNGHSHQSCFPKFMLNIVIDN